MARRIQSECDWCHATISELDEEAFWAQFYELGWVAVSEGPEEKDIKEFCSAQCLVSHYE